MSETVKLIIEIPKEEYEFIKNLVVVPPKDSYCELIVNAVPLEEVKTKIETDLSWDMYDEYGNETCLHKSLMQILDNIGKESEE